MCKNCFADSGYPGFEIGLAKLEGLKLKLELPNQFGARLYKACKAYIHRHNRLISDKGYDLAQIVRAENHLRKNPGNVLERRKLVLYYGARKNHDDYSRKSFHKHALYLIARAADSEFLPCIELSKTSDKSAYDQAEELWLNHISRDPDNIRVLENAYIYFMTKDLGITGLLAQRLKELEPQNINRILELVRYYRYMMLHSKPAQSKLFALNIYLVLKEAFESFDSKHRLLFLFKLPEAAYDAGYKGKSIDYAKKMILYLEASVYQEAGVDSGAALHNSHLWIARVSFEKGDMDMSREHFLKAASFRPVVYQSLVGPDLNLADRFLKAKEYKTVLLYLKLCSKSWKSGIIMDWVDDMRKGQLPDFQPYMI